MLKPTKKYLDERIRFYESLIPEVYPSGKFPVDFKLMPLDWALDDATAIRQSVDAVIDGKERQIRPIGTLDVEFLSNDIVGSAKEDRVNLREDYPCGLNCPGCFNQEDIYRDSKSLMTWQEVVKHIDDARAIGLSSIKFLGPGEMFQNPDLFDILDALKERKLPISIFTKGAELGDDELARQNYGHLGISSAEELTKRLTEYDNVRILLGFNSFIPERQDAMVGSYPKATNYRVVDGKFIDRGIPDYTMKRDRALVNLVNAGFTNPTKGQRLSLVAAPTLLEQIDEVPEMYVWAAKRNMPLVIAPSMESGPKARALKNHNLKIDSDHERMIDMYDTVYSRAIDEGILSYDRIKKEGISPYMGTAPCNQVANGMYLRLNGQVQICPGKSDKSVVYGNVHQNSITSIWVNSPNYQRTDLTNNWCPGKPDQLPEEVKCEIERRLSAKYQLK